MTPSKRTRTCALHDYLGVSMVLRQGIRLSLIGIVLGGVASVAVARVLAAALVGLGTPNPLIYVVVPAGLAGLTAAASYFPARRASRVNPLVALRCD